MQHEADVVVIGAGIVGCASAYYLARRGVQVVLVEQMFVGRHGVSPPSLGHHALAIELHRVVPENVALGHRRDRTFRKCVHGTWHRGIRVQPVGIANRVVTVETRE